MTDPRKQTITIMIVASLLVLTVLPIGSLNTTDSFYSTSTDYNFQVSDVPEDPIPLSRATFISYDPDSYIDDFAYMAAIPSSLFFTKIL